VIRIVPVSDPPIWLMLDGDRRSERSKRHGQQIKPWKGCRYGSSCPDVPGSLYRLHATAESIETPAKTASPTLAQQASIVLSLHSSWDQSFFYLYFFSSLSCISISVLASFSNDWLYTLHMLLRKCLWFTMMIVLAHNHRLRWVDHSPVLSTTTGDRRWQNWTLFIELHW